MFQKVPYVRAGDPIAAETFNKLVDRANAPESTPTARPVADARPEFWIKNAGNATIPALSTVRIDGFASSFASASDAKGAIASARIVLNASASTGSTACAVALEGIPGGQVGRARSTTAPLFFAILTGSASVAVDSRASYASGSGVVDFEPDASGDYVVAAFDSTSRLAALYFSPLASSSGSASAPTYSLGVVAPSSRVVSSTIDSDGNLTSRSWTITAKVWFTAYALTDGTWTAYSGSQTISKLGVPEIGYSDADFVVVQNANANDVNVLTWRGVGSSAGRFKTLAANAPLSLAVAGDVATLSLDTSGLGGGGTTYSAGYGINIEDGEISCTLTPTTYTPGSGISIEDGEISCTLTPTTYSAGDGINIEDGEISCTLTPTTYSAGDGIRIEDGEISCTLTPTTYTPGSGISIEDGEISCTLTPTTYSAGDGIRIEDGEISCTLTPTTYTNGTRIRIDADGSINCVLVAGEGINIDGSTISGNYVQGTGININGNIISGAYTGANGVSVYNGVISGAYQQGTGISISGSTISGAYRGEDGITFSANVVRWDGVGSDGGAFRTLEVESPLTLDVDGTTATLGIDATGLDGTVYTPGTYIAITNGRIDCTLTPTTYTPGSGISIEDGEISCTLTQTTYSAGYGINIEDGEISCTLTQTTYSAGYGINIEDGEISCTLTPTVYTQGSGISIANGVISCTLDPPTYSSGTNIQIGADGSINCTLTPTFSLQAYSESSGSWGLAQSGGADLYNAATSAFRYDSGDFATNADGVFRWSGVRSTDGNGGAFRTLNATGAASLSFAGDVATLDVETPPEYEVRATAPSTVESSTETDDDDGTETKVFTLTAKIKLQAYAQDATTDVWALATSGGSSVYDEAIAAFKYDNEDFETNASDVFCWRGVDSDDGRFTKLEVDSSAPLTLDVSNGVATLGLDTSGLGGTTYVGGDGINVTGSTISNEGYFYWGVWDGSAYGSSANNTITRTGTHGTLCFSPRFSRTSRRDDAGGYEVDLRTITLYVAEMASDGTLTRKQVRVLALN